MTVNSEKKRNKKKKPLCTELYSSFAAVAFLKKNRVFSLHDCERGPRTNGEESDLRMEKRFKLERLARTGSYGQSDTFSWSGFRSCRRVRARGKECRMQPFHGEISRPWQNAAGRGSGRLNSRCYKL